MATLRAQPDDLARYVHIMNIQVRPPAAPQRSNNT